MTPNYNHIRATALKKVAADLNVIDSYKNLSVPEIAQQYLQNSLPFAVCCLNIIGDLNVGMILRTAATFGAEKFLVFGRTRYDARTAVGMNNYLPVERISGMLPVTDSESAPQLDPEVFISTMQQYNYIPLFCEQGGVLLGNNNPVIKTLFDTIQSNKQAQKLCLVFGNEAIGITPEFMRTVADAIPNTTTISIPQRGVCRSLNVAAAASILIWEVVNIVA